MSYFASNRAAWDRQAENYHEIMAEWGDPAGGYSWGWWAHPEDELRVLGDVSRLDVLDLGCGPAGGALKLVEAGARVVGLDGSGRQLGYARRAIETAGQRLPLVHADAERLPFADASFDVAVSNWGALTFCDPVVAVPEAARVLRVGGLLVICSWSPLFWLCADPDTQEPSAVLRRSYADLHRWPGSSGTVRFQLTYGGWISLFSRTSLHLEDLVEPAVPPEPPIPAHLDETAWRSWITRWPFECIWKARKLAARPATASSDGGVIPDSRALPAPSGRQGARHRNAP